MKSDLLSSKHQAERNPQPFALESPKLLRAQVLPGRELVAAAGSMVAYRGQVSFRHRGSGSIGGFIKKKLSGEDAPLMRMEGQGEVFLARQAQDIFTLLLEGEGISASSRALLAFEGQLAYDIKLLRSAGSLFNVTVSGQGRVAVTSDGPPLLLDCSREPVYVDPQAVVCWSSSLQPALRNDASLGALFGRGSGEAFQMVFSGPGFVVVAPSEGAASHPGVRDSGGSGGVEGALGSLMGG